MLAFVSSYLMESMNKSTQRKTKKPINLIILETTGTHSDLF